MPRTSNNNEEITKLTIAIPKNMHAFIKAQSALNHVSVKDFIINAIMQTTDHVDENRTLKASVVKELEQSMRDYKAGKLQRFTTAEEAIDYLNSDLEDDE